MLFGKSGYGKSSLLNAGILPALKEIVPIVIRFKNHVPKDYQSEQSSPLAQIHQKISELEKSPKAALLDTFNLSPSLWLDLKRAQTPKRKRFLFVFDQFEEFFTYPVTDQYLFKEQLAELIYTELPQVISDKYNDDLAFLDEPFDARVIFSIRWDRLGLLDSLKDKLAAILHKRYELKGLTKKQAEEAIINPGLVLGSFKTSPFKYTPAALSKLLDELTKSVSEGQKSSVEAFQLQIICQSIESKVEQTRLQHITLSDLPDLSDIYTTYYNRQIETLEPASLRLPAQLVIEDELIDEREARRLSVDSRTLLRREGVAADLLDKLEDTFLIRRENNTVGGFSYEVSHDTLIAPILEAKKERRIDRERLENERKLREAEKQAAKDREDAEKERIRNEQLQTALLTAEEAKEEAERSAWRARTWLIAAVFALIVASGLAVWALQKQREAETATLNAEANLRSFKQTQFTAFILDAETFCISHDIAEKNAAIDSARKIRDTYFLGTATIDSMNRDIKQVDTKQCRP